MKRFLLLILVLFGLTGAGQAQTYYSTPPQKLRFDGDSSTSIVLTKDLAIIKVERENLAMTLWKRTDGTSDTLLVQIHQTNDLTDPDTLKWLMLTTFGGTKPDTTHVHRIYFSKPIVSTDTTHPIGRFLRIRANHLGVSTVKQLATDSSTWEIWFSSWGDPLK